MSRRSRQVGGFPGHPGTGGRFCLGMWRRRRRHDHHLRGRPLRRHAVTTIRRTAAWWARSSRPPSRRRKNMWMLWPRGGPSSSCSTFLAGGRRPRCCQRVDGLQPDYHGLRVPDLRLQERGFLRRSVQPARGRLSTRTDPGRRHGYVTDIWNGYVDEGTINQSLVDLEAS